MHKWINSLVTAAVIILLVLGIADFLFFDRFNAMELSGSACAPILCGAFHRWASKPAPRFVMKRK